MRYVYTVLLYICGFSHYCTVDQILVRTVGNIRMSGSIVSIGHAVRSAQHNNIACALHLYLCGNVRAIIRFDSKFHSIVLNRFHSHRLYRIEVVGLLALWRVVSGRRKNILKGKLGIAIQIQS